MLGTTSSQRSARAPAHAREEAATHADQLHVEFRSSRCASPSGARGGCSGGALEEAQAHHSALRPGDAAAQLFGAEAAHLRRDPLINHLAALRLHEAGWGGGWFDVAGGAERGGG
jgi:hypothetical protein